MALCFLDNGIVHLMVVHPVMLNVAESKQTRGKTPFKSPSQSPPPCSLQGTLPTISCYLLSHDSPFISVQFKLMNLKVFKVFESHSMGLPFLFRRHVCDTSDGHRCRWPHLWQQRSSGLQYPPWPAVLFRRPQNRWENNRIDPRMLCYISTLWFIHTYKPDWPTLETEVDSHVETFGCNIWVY